MKESKLMRVISRWAARYYLKRPDQEEIIYLKHPRLSDLWPALLNEIYYRLRWAHSFRLTGLNIELTNRCNLSCRHCLRTGTDPRHQRDMDMETFRHIIDGVPQLKTLLPFQWGEPLLHPNLYECISYAANRGIRVMLTTNGTLLDEETSRRLIQAGLSRLTVSFDGNKETHAHLRGIDPDLVIANAVQFKEIRDRLGASCALDFSMVVNEMTEPFMDDFRDLFREISDRIQYIPSFVRGRREMPCRELWRGVLVALSNGNITVCCADVKGEASIGNITEEAPSDLFNGPAMQEIRRRHACRDFPELCRCCAEYRSPRVSPRFS